MLYAGPAVRAILLEYRATSVSRENEKSSPHRDRDCIDICGYRAALHGAQRIRAIGARSDRGSYLREEH